jgi:hypothetical protein
VSTPSPSPRTPLRCVGPLTPPRSASVCPWWSVSGAPPRNTRNRARVRGKRSGSPLPRGQRPGLLRIPPPECARAFPHFRGCRGLACAGLGKPGAPLSGAAARCGPSPSWGDPGRYEGGDPPQPCPGRGARRCLGLRVRLPTRCCAPLAWQCEGALPQQLSHGNEPAAQGRAAPGPPLIPRTPRAPCEPLVPMTEVFWCARSWNGR